jgi:hypothetical protein
MERYDFTPHCDNYADYLEAKGHDHTLREWAWSADGTYWTWAQQVANETD